MSEELCECRQCVKKREESRLAAAAIEVAVLTVYDDPDTEDELPAEDARPDLSAPPGLHESPEEDSISIAEINRLSLMNVNPPPAAAGGFRDHVTAVTDRLREVLLRQEDQFTAAASPVRIFSKVDPIEKLNLRIDDNLSRLMRGEDSAEDLEWSLITDLTLKRVAMEMAARNSARE